MPTSAAAISRNATTVGLSLQSTKGSEPSIKSFALLLANVTISKALSIFARQSSMVTLAISSARN